MTELETIYDCERAKFTGFGTYTLPIEERVNEIIEMKENARNKKILVIMKQFCFKLVRRR